MLTRNGLRDFTLMKVKVVATALQKTLSAAKSLYADLYLKIGNDKWLGAVRLYRPQACHLQHLPQPFLSVSSLFSKRVVFDGFQVVPPS